MRLHHNNLGIGQVRAGVSQSHTIRVIDICHTHHKAFISVDSYWVIEN